MYCYMRTSGLSAGILNTCVSKSASAIRFFKHKIQCTKEEKDVSESALTLSRNTCPRVY